MMSHRKIERKRTTGALSDEFCQQMEKLVKSHLGPIASTSTQIIPPPTTG